MAIVILFGAGASYGSAATLPYPPPLGNQLFNELEKLNGVAAKIPDDLKSVFRENFEKGMSEYYIHANGDVMAFQREMGGYFSKFTPLIRNNYIKLIKSLAREDVIYSSLNYDLLFEISAEKSHFLTHYSNKKHPMAQRLLKIHGSSNFWPQIKGLTMRGCKFTNGVDADIDFPIETVNQSQAIKLSMTEDSLAPAMAMFLEGKNVRVSPFFVKEQYRMWCDSVLNASKVFIIGVRVHLVDTHIWGILGRTTADINYFGFPADKSDFSSWKISSKKQNAYFHQSDFSSSINKIRSLI
ncbi:TPA: hypothetical protein R4079_003862 [Raoultella ornithinolytica]|nr:hypothetical protein [Raoultella ornithinolytica]HED3218873.1 hypothetical protein [Raoultella ornithinolytica]